MLYGSTTCNGGCKSVRLQVDCAWGMKRESYAEKGEFLGHESAFIKMCLVFSTCLHALCAVTFWLVFFCWYGPIASGLMSAVLAPFSCSH